MKNIFTILLMTVSCGFAEDKWVKDETPMPPTNRVVFTRPERFRQDIAREPGDKLRAALRFRSFGSDGAEMLNFKLFPTKDPNARLTNQKQMDDVVREMTAPKILMSIEKTNVIQRLVCDSGFGSCCVLTDAELVGVAKLPPGQFRHIVIGLVKVDDCFFWIEGYVNEKEGDDIKAMFKIIAKLKIESQTIAEKPK